MNETNDPLQGKIVVSKLQEKEHYVYVNSDIPASSFKFPLDQEIKYSGVDWFHTKDTFLGTERISGPSNIEYKSNIVEFDLTGKLIGRIYEAKEGELAWPSYTSWDDKYLLFLTERNVDPIKYPLEGLTPMVSLGVIDLTKNRVVTKIDSIGRIPNLEIKESPWLYNRYQFVYSIIGATKLILNNEEKLLNPVEDTEGIYLHDVATGENQLLVPNGHSAIASPISIQIAFEKNNSIIVLDLNTNEEKVIYEHSSKEKLFGKHWTPDGKHIYFAYRYDSGIRDLFNSGEKLIEVSTGNEVPFKKIGHGFHPYSWK